MAVPGRELLITGSEAGPGPDTPPFMMPVEGGRCVDEASLESD
jgi:hypothetical protein